MLSAFSKVRRSYPTSPTESPTSLCESISVLGFASDPEEEEDEELAAFARELGAPDPGSLKRVQARSPYPPTPPTIVARTTKKKKGARNLSAEFERETRTRTPTIQEERAEAEEEESLLTQVLNPSQPEVRRPRATYDFFALKGIQDPKLYFETTLAQAIDRELEAHGPAIKQVGLTNEGFLWTALGVAHFCIVSAAGYEGKVLKKPHRHPHTKENVWGDALKRDVPIAELIVALSRNAVQRYGALLHGIIPQALRVEDFGTYDIEKNIPRSDLQVCPSHLIVALSFLAHIGVVHIKCGYQPPRGRVRQVLASSYSHKLAELFYISSTQPYAGPYDGIEEERTIYVTTIADYAYAWYYLLRNVLVRIRNNSYEYAGFNVAALLDDYSYSWHWDADYNYWCPVLLDGYAPYVTLQPGVLY